jgi:methylated-DNA-[protein]-cysteine S-methyltransferase
MSAHCPRIVSLHLNEKSRGVDDFAIDPILRSVKETIIGFLDGKIKDLSKLRIDLTRHPPFTQKVLRAARSIRWGKTLSYADLAKRVGNPGAIRAVASVMRNNPFPLIIPCHRVIRSNGSIGGFMGKTGGKEIELKIRLLEREKTKIGRITE